MGCVVFTCACQMLEVEVWSLVLQDGDGDGELESVGLSHMPGTSHTSPEPKLGVAALRHQAFHRPVSSLTLAPPLSLPLSIHADIPMSKHHGAEKTSSSLM